VNITKQQLKQIIREEISNVLQEGVQVIDRPPPPRSPFESYDSEANRVVDQAWMSKKRHPRPLTHYPRKDWSELGPMGKDQRAADAWMWHELAYALDGMRREDIDMVKNIVRKAEKHNPKPGQWPELSRTPLSSEEREYLKKRFAGTGATRDEVKWGYFDQRPDREWRSSDDEEKTRDFALRGSNVDASKWTLDDASPGGELSKDPNRPDTRTLDQFKQGLPPEEYEYID